MQSFSTKISLATYYKLSLLICAFPSNLVRIAIICTHFAYKKTLILAISQSGETADTLAAVREAKRKGAKIISVCNVLGSSLARESDGVLYTHAGPEIGVASTKAYTAQLCMLYLIASLCYW